MGHCASVADAARKQGNERFAAADYAAAVRIYARILANAAHSDKHLLHSNLAACYMAAGLYAAALDAADAAVEAQPGWAKGHFRRAAILAALELWPEASLSLERAALSEPQNSGVHKLKESVAAHMPEPQFTGGGMAHSWGKGEFGALGHGDAKDRSSPKVIDALRGVRLVDATCGTGHSLVVSEEGDVWAWGWNSKGQCGLPPAHGETVSAPTMVGSLLGKRVCALASGAAHSLALTRSGEVYSWGHGQSGQLGLGDLQNSSLPRLVRGLSAELVRGVACGFGHSLALTQSGALLSWGWNQDGQLGVGDTQTRSSPCRLSGLGCTFQQVACGGAHSAAVCTTGQLWCFGSNSCGQLGLGAFEDRVTRPTLVTFLVEAKVTCALVACGEEFTLAISKSQDMYAFGLGNVGQMGSGTEESFALPTLVEAMCGRGAELACCGAAQVHTVCSDGRVWVWGAQSENNTQLLAELSPGRSSLGSFMPVEMRGLRSRSVMRLEAGRRHFLALTAPASPHDSILDWPTEWGPGGVRVVAGRRYKFFLKVVDIRGERRTVGGERVVGRLVWDPGDSALPGSRLLPDADAEGEEGEGKRLLGLGVDQEMTASKDGVGGQQPMEKRDEVAATATRQGAAAAAAKQAAVAAMAVEVDDNLDGSYDLCMRPRLEGSAQLWVLLNGEHVLGSPRAVHVVCAFPAARQCLLRAVRTEVSAGVAAEVEIVLMDEFGNELSSPPPLLPLELCVERVERGHKQVPDGGLHTRDQQLAPPRATNELPVPTFSIGADGIVRVQMVATDAGMYKLGGSIRGESIPGFINVRVHPARAVAVRSRCVGDSSRSVRAGHAIAMAVHCVDAFGNETNDAPLTGLLNYIYPGGCAAPRVQVLAAQADGVAALTFTPTTAGEVHLRVQLEGEDLPGCPFEVQVLPSVPHALRCTLEGEGLAGTVVRQGGLKRNLTLHTSDIYGNQCKDGGAAVCLSLKLGGFHVHGTPSLLSYAMDEDATSTLEPVGARSLSPTNRQRSACSPALVPLSSQPSRSVAKPTSPPVSPPAAAGKLVGHVVDNRDGTYLLSYRALAGEWLLHVEVDGRAVPPTPCSVVNAVDPAEDEERRAKEEMERLQQQAQLEADLRRQREREEDERAREQEQTRLALEDTLWRQARSEDEKLERQLEQARKRAAQEEEKRRRIMATLKREMETKQRAEAALKAVMDERQKQLIEAERRKKTWSRRTGGGFVVNFCANDGTTVEEL